MSPCKKFWLLALAAGGCNQVFDLGNTRPLDAAIPVDAQYFDAPNATVTTPRRAIQTDYNGSATFYGAPLGDPNSSAIYWTQRASTTDRFGVAVKVTTVPLTGTTPYMADDCSRYYFSGLGSVFYQTQL